MKNQFKVRWLRTLLIIALGTPLITFPMWHRLLFPGFWSDNRCVYSDASGTHKGSGTECEAIGL